jgi:hypothetical protein
MHDCICVVAPIDSGLYLWKIFDLIEDFDVPGGSDVWYVRPFLSLLVQYVPLIALMGNTTLHKDVSLVFFNIIEPIILTPGSCMQRKGVPMLYKRAASQSQVP